MYDMNSNTPTNGIPEASVAKILARAAELDRIAPTVQMDVLRAAAMEAGISADAIERALEEFATGDVPVPAPIAEPEPKRAPFWKRVLSKLAHPVALFALSFTIGGIATDAEFFIFVGFMLLIGLATRTAWRARSVKDIGSYAAIVFALAWGFGLGMGAGNGDEDAIATYAVTSIFMMVSGLAFIYLRNIRKLTERQPV